MKSETYLDTKKNQIYISIVMTTTGLRPRG